MNSESFNYNYYPASGLSAQMTLLLYGIAILAVMIGIVVVVLNTRKQKNLIPRIIGTAFMVTGLCLGIFVFYRDHFLVSAPVFAPRAMLSALWTNYKESYVDPTSGRTFDTQNGDDTTSEGESYTMLRAVWMDDETTFDQSWAWTQKNLQRPNDHLFSWLYGTQSSGAEGILADQGGQNSASDADTDIALALVFAYSRWQNPAYLQDAMDIIPNIWSHDVFMADGRPYMGVSNFASSPATEEIVNPSYFSPYAYRIFSVLDPQQDWNGLIKSSYALLQTSMSSSLDKNMSAGLPPDWVEVNTINGNVSAPIGSSVQTSQFGYDAIRVPWRLALDWEWYHDPQDQTILRNMSFLGSTWATTQSLDAVYGHDGSVVGDYESPAMYGGTMGYFIVADPAIAQQVYVQKLVSLYSPDTETWTLPLSYYDSNIAWFGMALYQNALPDLFALMPSGPSASTDLSSYVQQ